MGNGDADLNQCHAEYYNPYDRWETAKLNGGLISRVLSSLGVRAGHHFFDEAFAEAQIIVAGEIFDSFDPCLGFQWSTFAFPSLRGYMIKYLKAQDLYVGSESFRRARRKLNEATRHLEGIYCRRVEDSEIAEYFGVSVDRIHEIRDRAASGVKSFATGDDEIDWEEANILEVSETVSGEMSAAISESLLCSIDGDRFYAELNSGLKRLSKKARFAICSYLAIDGADKLSLDEIAEQIHFSKERVYQLINKGLRKIGFYLQKGEIIPEVVWKDMLVNGEADAMEPKLMKGLPFETYMRDLLQGLEGMSDVRRRTIIERHLGLNGREEEHLSDIGRGYGLTRERTRQLFVDGLNKIGFEWKGGRLIPQEVWLEMVEAKRPKELLKNDCESARVIKQVSASVKQEVKQIEDFSRYKQYLSETPIPVKPFEDLDHFKDMTEEVRDGLYEIYNRLGFITSYYKRFLVVKYLGFDGEKPWSNKHLAKVIGVSPSNCRQKLLAAWKLMGMGLKRRNCSDDYKIEIRDCLEIPDVSLELSVDDMEVIASVLGSIDPLDYDLSESIRMRGFELKSFLLKVFGNNVDQDREHLRLGKFNHSADVFRRLVKHLKTVEVAANYKEAAELLDITQSKIEDLTANAATNKHLLPFEVAFRALKLLKEVS